MVIDRGRLQSLMTDRGISQSELGRRVGVAQATIYKLTSGASYGSRHLHKIARVLGTTPAYLTGEIDDPTEGAPPPLPEPQVQLVTATIALPSEDALADAFEGLLMASPNMDQPALARELAKRLPLLLRVAAGAIAVAPMATLSGDREAELLPADGHRERRRA